MSGFPYDYQITVDKPPSIFSAEELEERFVTLFQVAQSYQMKYMQRFGVKLQLDPRLLYISVVSTFDDIARYKAYHLERPYTDRSDAVKRSAYLTKWLAKIGVFQTAFDWDEEDFSKVLRPNLNARTALANISFAIFVSMIHILLNVERAG